MIRRIDRDDIPECVRVIRESFGTVADDILEYAKAYRASFEQRGVSSNEVRTFEYEGRKYVIKSPLMVGDSLSPFWRMMEHVFHFTFARQNAGFGRVYNVLKDNPHIPVPVFVAADDGAMVFEYTEGASREGDEFPAGKENAYRLGQYVGYLHQSVHQNCGILGTEDVTDFFSAAASHMEACINAHWNSEERTDRRVRAFWEALRQRRFGSAGYSLIMADMSADQFLYDKDRIAACVDLDAYVIGPVEWELSFLRKQVEDWDSFRAGYETYQNMPQLEEVSDFFFFLMALNSYENKCEIEDFWFGYFAGASQFDSLPPEEWENGSP